MAHTITISDDLYQQLEQLAEGFDTPERVIQKLVNRNKPNIHLEINKPLHLKKDENERMKITSEMVHAVYNISKDIYAEKIALEKAQDVMFSKFNMDRGSAGAYIRNFLKMINGELYTRTMNKYATQYYLNNIHKDYGVDTLGVALFALEQHIPYYQKTQKSSGKYLLELYNNFHELAVKEKG